MYNPIIIRKEYYVLASFFIYVIVNNLFYNLFHLPIVGVPDIQIRGVNCNIRYIAPDIGNPFMLVGALATLIRTGTMIYVCLNRKRFSFLAAYIVLPFLLFDILSIMVSFLDATELWGVQRSFFSVTFIHKLSAVLLGNLFIIPVAVVLCEGAFLIQATRKIGIDRNNIFYILLLSLISFFIFHFAGTIYVNLNSQG
jgi:hypothetical protein